MKRLTLYCLCMSLLPLYTLAETPHADPLRVVHLRNGIDVLMGPGGNITVDSGGPQIVMVDGELPDLSTLLLSTLKTAYSKPVGQVIDTHWHADHVGGNQALREAGATVIAQVNVLNRMKAGGTIPFLGMTLAPAPESELPTHTYDQEMTLYSGDVISLIHVPNAHTDGDTLIKWQRANVLATGDVYTHGVGLPYVDLASGGSLRGFIAGVDRCLVLSDSATRIVPGHGEPTTRSQLLAFRNQLMPIAVAIDQQVRAGKSLEQIQALGLTSSWPASAYAFVKPQQFVEMAVASLHADLSNGRPALR